MEEALTLSVDVGATSVKATCVARDGLVVGPVRRRRTRYPLDPDSLVAAIGELATTLEPAARAAVGFPGLVRHGRVLSAANLARVGGPGTPIDEHLVQRWHRFDLAGALAGILGVEVRVANDADVAALSCSTGRGVELTVTLGSGVGTGLVVDGRLAPHLELSELPLEGAACLDDLVGERARKHLEPAEWDRRVVLVVDQLDRIVHFDRCALTGGNARRLRRDALGDLLARVEVMDDGAGLAGGVRLFD